MSLAREFGILVCVHLCYVDTCLHLQLSAISVMLASESYRDVILKHSPCTDLQ